MWCTADATGGEAAAAMTAAGQSCALIDRFGEIGIVTDSDFRTALAVGQSDAQSPVWSLASFPAATIGADALVGDAFLRMVESGFHHLVVTGAADRLRSVGRGGLSGPGLHRERHPSARARRRHRRDGPCRRARTAQHSR
ncbi:hypothetical protein TUM20983_38020 [Mycobacterium antarcticum]|nr:hypothetical protein TUM20983_38020 [Mycolicibacterium sp. TUM20983]